MSTSLTDTTLTRTTAPQSDDAASPRLVRDWRPSQRATGTVLTIGGLVYALSHMLNLLGSTPSLSAPNEVLAKVLFGAGALLIMAGAGSLIAQFRRSPVGILGTQLTWVGMLFILQSAYSVLFIFPLYGWEGLGAIDERAGVVSLLALPTVFGGPLLVAIAGLRHRVVPVPAAVGIFAASAMFIVMIGVPELEPPMAIASTIVYGLSWALTGLRARNAG